MSQWNCRIGKVTPRLSVHRGNDDIYDTDWWNDGAFIENFIGLVRSKGNITSYSVVATHDDGLATVGTRSGPARTNLQVIGGLVVEAVRRAKALDEAS
ncbi:MAG: hypothetical protein OEU92_30920 [Alphaproteobacteria bacterium]|nr:hypothetical protein [Alphaproteobacteria bacterium]